MDVQPIVYRTTSAKEGGLGHKMFAGLLALFSIYAGVFIVKTSFVFEGTRYFTLYDDMMIGMRYAKNLAFHRQLVWNLGERVEGFTNPLWVLYLAVLHRLDVPQSKLSLLVQLTGAVLLAGTAWIVYRIAYRLSEGSLFCAIAAAVFTLSYYPLINWCLQGFEVSLLAFLIALAVDQSEFRRSSGAFSVLPSILLGIAIFTRIDMVIPLAVFTVYAILMDRHHWMRNLTIGGGTGFLCLALQEIARWVYYGELVPNTYLQKLDGIPLILRLERGALVAAHFLLQLNPIIVLISLVPLGLPKRKSGLIASLFIMQVAYSIWVGGDAWEQYGGSNRYIAIVMPIYFVLLACGLNEFASFLAKRLLAVRQNNFAAVAASCAIVVSAMIAMNVYTGTPAHGDVIFGLTSSARRWILSEAPPDIPELHDHAKLGLLLSKVTAPSAKIAVVWAGALPYFADRPAVDLLGKCDKIIAREKMQPIDFYPGHVKWDYPYSLSHYNPDIIVETWPPEQAEPLLSRDYRAVNISGINVYALKSSQAVDWKAINAAVRPGVGKRLSSRDSMGREIMN